MAQPDLPEPPLPVLVIEGDKDSFNGVIVKPRHYGLVGVEEFTQRLTASIKAWKQIGKRGVWLTIPLSQSELIPVAAKLDFKFHHSKPDHVTMTRWLPESEESTLPIYATHNIGVGGFVVNDKNEVLLIQEKWLRGIKVAHWKFPGGVCDPGEDLWKTAMRETLEETGIRTEFVSVLSFRQLHGYTWGIDDLYFTCLLRPLNTDIQPNPNEIAAAKWMDIDEFIADPSTYPANAFIAESYKKLAQGNCQTIQPIFYPHFINTKPDVSIYQVRSCDLSKSCDLSTKKWSWELKDQVEQVVASLDHTPKSNI